MSTKGRSSEARLRLVALLIGVALSLVVAEGAARAIRSARRAAPRPPVDRTALDVYEEPDPADPTRWRLRAGTRLTLAEALAAKRATGQTLGVAALAAAGALVASPDTVVFEVNRDGYKGPELDPEHRRPRVLALGDSCTFGTLVDAFSYPRVIERELARMGWEVEVINGGVEAYRAEDVRLRLGELVRLAPEVTTLYIGWNDLYREERAAPPPLALPGLVRSAWRRLAMSPREAALAELGKPRRPDPAARAVARLERWKPSFLGEIEAIATALTAAGSRVVLVTLPGLFAADQAPSANALAIGHLPYFTDNPYVLAGMAERYNRELAALGERRGLPVIDLAAWSRKALVPRDRYFIDSVHLTPAGQERIGVAMARELAGLIAATGDAAGRSATPPAAGATPGLPTF